jgi:polyisoprenoid-binding protein YceI
VRKEILVTTIVLFFFFPLLAQTSYQAKETNMTIAGTSTLHDWVSKVLDVEASGNFVVNDKVVEDIQNLKVSIKVKSIESPKGRIMDNKTYDALKEEDNPFIKFTLTKINSAETTYFGQQMEVAGKLTIAGKTLPVTMDVKGKVESNGDLKFEGSKELNMRDFEMDPPKAMLGAIKTGESVTIDYSITFSKS